MSSEELQITLPWEIVDKGKGLSLDLGGSLIKIAYLCKNNWLEPSKRAKGSQTCLHLTSFEHGSLGEALDFLKTHCHIIREQSNERVTICVAGLRQAEKNQIEAALNVRCLAVKEVDCYVKSSLFITKNLPRKEALAEISQNAYDTIRKKGEGYLAAMAKLQEVTSGFTEKTLDPVVVPKLYTDQQDLPMAESQQFFPCLLYMCGSSCKCLLIHEDGRVTEQKGSTIGEKGFLGVASLLSESKTYKDTMALADSGNAFKVAATNKDLQTGMDKEGEEDNMYNIFTDDTMVEEIAFLFGHTVGKSTDDFEKADMVRCVLELVVQEMVHGAHITFRDLGAKSLVFCGGFTSQACVQEMVSREWLERDVIYPLFMQMQCEQRPFYFLHQGLYLGAIGAYLKQE